MTGVQTCALPIYNHGLQVGQFERDRELLQAAISKLEEDLSFARRAQDQLDDQKQENVRSPTGLLRRDLPNKVC